MKVKDIIIIALLLAVAVLCFHAGTQRAVRKKDSAFRLITDKAMYEAAERGDLQKIKSSFGILVLSDVRDYERRFGAPTGTNRLARDFAQAQIIAQKVESQLVPISSIATNISIISNIGSNVTITVKTEK